MKKKENDSTKESVNFSTVTKYIKKYKWYFVVGSVSVVITNLLILYIPYITKIIFDLLEDKASINEIRDYVLLSILLALVAGIFRFGMRRTIIWMSRYFEYDLRGEIMSHLLKLSPSFYHRTRTGDIMARITNDLEAVRQMVGPGIMYISDSIVKLVIAFSVMIYLSVDLTIYSTLLSYSYYSSIFLLQNTCFIFLF